MKNKKLILLSILSTFINITFAIPPINLFRPSDRPLHPEPLLGVSFQFQIADETSYKTKAFQENFDEFHSTYCLKPDREVNALRIYQDKQNLVAALKGTQSQSDIGQFLQKFNINDENGTLGLYAPSGKLSVPFNIMLSSRYYFDHNIILACYLPALAMELKDVKWNSVKEDGSDNNHAESKNIYQMAKQYGDLDISGWKRIGIGDLTVQGIWMGDFPQDRPLLRNVRPQLRLATIIPTGKEEDIDKLLAFPFANDGAWGVMVSGGLDLFFTSHLKAGFDAEFLFLFGNTKLRRIKTNCDQTDLLLFTKMPAFKEFGMNQQFNLYAAARWSILQFKIDYQYLKNEESKLYVCSNKLNPLIVNSAESLQDWTAHSLILGLKCYFDDHINISFYKPAIQGLLKLGFNGKRCIAIDSLSINLTSNF